MADPMTHSHDTATPALSVATVPSEEFVRKVLETARDYISDAAAGTLTYEDSGEGFKAMAAEDLVRLDAALSASHLAKEGGEGVVVPYDDFHAAYQFVPRSKMSPDHCLKTRLRSLLRDEDLAHADEAEAIAAAPAPNPSPAAKGGEARLLFYIRDEGPNRFYLTWAEAIADAEEQIAVCRRDARQDGEWSWSAEEISIYACDAETEEPEEDGVLMAQSCAILAGVDDDGREHFDYAMKLALATPSPQPAHSDDLAVDRFAVAMKAKLADARAKGKGGWNDEMECSRQYLSDELRRHALKPDPLDVANFAMFLHQRNEEIALPSPRPANAVRELLREVESETPPDDQPREGQGAYVYMTWETIDALRAALESDPASAAMGWEAEAFAVSDSEVCQLIEACKRNGFPHTQSCLLELLERRKTAALARPLSQPAEAEAETFKRERDDARKVLERVTATVQRLYEENCRENGVYDPSTNATEFSGAAEDMDILLQQILEELQVPSAARSAYREGASDE